MKPLLEIERPWLTRDDLEGLIWRLTGTKSEFAVEQLLRAADAYAVSQGPGLIAKLRERDISRRRYVVRIPPLSSVPPRASAAGSEVIGAGADDGTQPAKPAEPELAGEPEPAEPYDGTGELSDYGVSLQPVKLPSKAAGQVWRRSDGVMIQRCNGCGLPKPYDEFHRDSNRWNDRASRCKDCKSKTRAGVPVLWLAEEPREEVAV